MTKNEKHREQFALNTINKVFQQRVDPDIRSVKFPDVWPI